MTENRELWGNIHRLKEADKYSFECIQVVQDFLHYFEYMKECRVRGIGLSKDRDADAGVIEFCLQSIEKAKSFKER